MKHSSVRAVVAVMVLFFALGHLIPAGADEGTILSIRRASTDIRNLAFKQPPEEPSLAKQESFIWFRDLLVALSEKLDEIAQDAGKAPMRDHSEKIIEAYVGYELDYLRLQEEIRNHGRDYTGISEILKERHDLVTIAIDNIR